MNDDGSDGRESFSATCDLCELFVGLPSMRLAKIVSIENCQTNSWLAADRGRGPFGSTKTLYVCKLGK
jgi:hypothetical protein